MHIGIVGGGQLGRMMTLAAKNFGYTVTVLDPTEDCPAAQVADRHILGSFAEKKSVLELASNVDVLTFEIESANDDALHILVDDGKTVHPHPDVLSIIRDKFKQSCFFIERDIPVAPFMEVTTLEEAYEAGEQYGYPFLLKVKSGAYDGRGNRLVKDKASCEEAYKDLGSWSELYAEKFVEFQKELAIVAARDVRGNIATYEVVETLHENNICHTVLSPADIPSDVRNEASRIATEVLKHLNGVGLYGIEMFLTNEGEILLNEVAPRVHNSGHHTMDSCVTSQFEQHIRAVTGLPLGSTKQHTKAAVMVNILGDRDSLASLEGIEDALALPDVHVHIYGKAEVRTERKMGHINACADTMDEALIKAKKAHELISL